MSERPDIAAFSCYVWNIEYIKQIAALIRLIDCNVKILYGGPEVSYNSEKFMKSFIGEYLIEGEGEDTYRELIGCLINNENLKNVKGLYYRYGDELHYNGKRPLMDMNKLVFPYDMDDNLNNKIVYYEASRGCPFNCKYCLSSTIRGVRFLNLDRVKAELDFLVQKKVSLVKFVDRTFNCSSKFAMSIWEYLIELDTDTAFHFEISADILSDEQIKLLSRAQKGKFQFEVGVQTTNDKILRNINRFIKYDEIKNQVLKVSEHENIKQHLDLIAGLPGEDFESFKKSFNDIYSINPDEIQLGFLKVLKGSPMEEEAESWGIVYSPYPPYEVLKTNHISYDEVILLKRAEEMVDKYYNSHKFNNIIRYFISKFETPFDFYLSLGMYFHNKGYFKRNISAIDYYKVFLEFDIEFLGSNSHILEEIIKFDYLKYNRKRWLPDFLTRNLDKSAERIIKEAVKKKIIEVSYNSYHIECFKIDIFGFIDKGVIKEGNYYLIFDDEHDNNIIDITYAINKEGLLY